MLFCPLCDNMMYMKTDDNLTLKMFCKNCAHSMDSDDVGLSKPVTDMAVNDPDEQRYKVHIDESSVNDVTLPRVDDIRCVNSACTKPVSSDNRVIYVKRDAVNLTFAYCCCFCNHVWTSVDHATNNAAA